MTLTSLKNKKVVFLGLGVENYYLIKYLLKKKVPCEIIVCDSRDKNQLEKRFLDLSAKKNIHWVLNKFNDKDLLVGDIIFRSPGWPLFDINIQTARKRGATISSPMAFFLEICPAKNIIGVTGTKGKGTTASLIYEILHTANKTVFLGGNIGVAPFSFFEKIKAGDYVVLELSSFQLEDLRISPKISVITNFSREHLKPADPNNPNHHKTLSDYWFSKLNIIRFQTKNGHAIINHNLKTKISKSFTKEAKPNGKLIYFKKSAMKSNLIGEHNKENIAAAGEVAKILKINNNKLKEAISNFKGLEHRIEFVGRLNDVEFYNDSFSTIPESAITAIKSFKKPIVLLAGGADKGNDFKELSKEIKARVKLLVLFSGEGSQRLGDCLHKTSYNTDRIIYANSMHEAMNIAKEKAERGDVILMSPGCASFGIFKNYKERGELFKKEFNMLNK